MLHKIKNWLVTSIILLIAGIAVWYFFFKEDKSEEEKVTEDKQALIAQFAGRY